MKANTGSYRGDTKLTCQRLSFKIVQDRKTQDLLIFRRNEGQDQASLLISFNILVRIIQCKGRYEIKEFVLVVVLWQHRREVSNGYFASVLLRHSDLFTLDHVDTDPQQPGHRLCVWAIAISVIKRFNGDLL